MNTAFDIEKCKAQGCKALWWGEEVTIVVGDPVPLAGTADGTLFYLARKPGVVPKWADARNLANLPETPKPEPKPRTLADVEDGQVYKTIHGNHVWRHLDVTMTRSLDGRIFPSTYRDPSAHVLGVHLVGNPLGHVSTNPWRKDAKPEAVEQPAREKPPQNKEHKCFGCGAYYSGEFCYYCNPSPHPRPTPAPSQQPPDVAVYRLTFTDGSWSEMSYIAGDAMFDRDRLGLENRTVLDAFARLGWDELMTRWGIKLSVKSGATWPWAVRGIGYKTQRDALLAAQDIARKEGWR